MMRRTTTAVLCAAGLLFLAACGGGAGGTGARVDSVTISGAPAAGQIEVGATIDLDVTVDASGGASTAATWTSSAPSVATVDGDGVVTGVAVGSATITATSSFDGSKSDTVSLQVVAAGSGAVTTVDVTPAAVSVNAGDTVQLSVVVNGNAGVSQVVTWTSVDGTIATVDADGLVTGVATGTTTVTATSAADPSKSGTATITVVSCGAAQELDHITAPTTLTGVAGCTDYLVNQFEVNVTAPLTIQPGVTIAFQQGSRFDVEAGGSVTANGTAAAPVTFTGQADVNGFWDGVRVFSAIPSKLEHVVIAYAGGDGTSDAGNLEIGSGGSVDLRNSVLRNSANYGMTVQSAGNLSGFSNNTLRDNKVTALISAHHIPQLDGASSYANGNTTNLIDVAGGSTDADGTWPATDAAYRLVEYELNVVDAITVADGVEFRFQGGSRLDIEAGGSVTATGSSAGITFRGASQLPGFWTGIRVFSAIPSVFDGVTFADGGGDGSSDAAIVELSGSGRASFEDSSFLNSANYGLTVQSSADLSGFAGNHFSGNRVPVLAYARHLVRLDGASTFATDNTENFIDVDGGSTDAGGTWPAAQVPYRVIAFELNVANAISIEDGAQLAFQANSRLDIEAGGALTASGGAEGILFTGTTQVAGHWNGVRVLSGSTATFDGVTVSYAGGSGSGSAANIQVSSGTLTLTNSTVDHSAGYGLYVSGGTASVTPNTAAAMLSQNTFSNNASGDVSGLP